MYYHRLIINFKKTASSNPYFLHLLVDIPQSRGDLSSYPNNFTGTYIVAYGVDADEVYDIKPTEVSYNVDVNADQKKILNVELDKNSDNSVATVKMAKDIIPFTKNNLYRGYFEEFYDFSDTKNYNMTIGASGVTFTGIKPNLTFQTSKDLSIINTDGLRLQYNYFNVVIPNSPNFTICVVMSPWLNKNFNIHFKIDSLSKKY